MPSRELLLSKTFSFLEMFLHPGTYILCGASKRARVCAFWGAIMLVKVTVQRTQRAALFFSDWIPSQSASFTNKDPEIEEKNPLERVLADWLHETFRKAARKTRAHTHAPRTHAHTQSTERIGGLWGHANEVDLWRIMCDETQALWHSFLSFLFSPFHTHARTHAHTHGNTHAHISAACISHGDGVYDKNKTAAIFPPLDNTMSFSTYMRLLLPDQSSSHVVRGSWIILGVPGVPKKYTVSCSVCFSFFSPTVPKKQRAVKRGHTAKLTLVHCTSWKNKKGKPYDANYQSSYSRHHGWAGPARDSNSTVSSALRPFSLSYGAVS